MKFTLPLPTSVNRSYKMGKGNFYKNDDCDVWAKEAWFKLRKCHKFGKANVEVFITYYFKDNRSDLGNRTKLLCDTLQKLQIIDNDNQIYALHEYKEIDKDNPRVKLEIWKLEE